MRRKAKKRGGGGKWNPMRFGSTWKEYRYGSTQPVYRDPILKGTEREAALEGALINLRTWSLSKFEREGETRAGIRIVLCERGYGWDEADTEASSLVSEGLHRIGAKRPSYDEGQWQYAIPRENCARCARPLDDADRATGFRYCSELCAKAFRVHLADQVPHDHELRQASYWQLLISKAPVLTCEGCKTAFKSRKGRGEQRFCTHDCATHHRVLQPKTCPWCEETFQPKNHDQVHCSMACRDRTRVAAWKALAEPIACQHCSTVFRPNSTGSKFCSKPCLDSARRARRRQEVRSVRCDACDRPFSAMRSDARFCSATCNSMAKDFRLRPPKVLSTRVFDYILRSRGVRITDGRITDALFAEAA